MLKLLCNQLNILLKVKIRFYLRNYPGEQCDQGPHSTVQSTVISVEAFTYYKRYEYIFTFHAYVVFAKSQWSFSFQSI